MLSIARLVGGPDVVFPHVERTASGKARLSPVATPVPGMDKVQLLVIDGDQALLQAANATPDISMTRDWMKRVAWNYVCASTALPQLRRVVLVFAGVNTVEARTPTIVRPSWAAMHLSTVLARRQFAHDFIDWVMHTASLAADVEVVLHRPPSTPVVLRRGERGERLLSAPYQVGLVPRWFVWHESNVSASRLVAWWAVTAGLCANNTPTMVCANDDLVFMDLMLAVALHFDPLPESATEEAHLIWAGSRYAGSYGDKSVYVPEYIRVPAMCGLLTLTFSTCFTSMVSPKSSAAPILALALNYATIDVKRQPPGWPANDRLLRAPAATRTTETAPVERVDRLIEMARERPFTEPFIRVERRAGRYEVTSANTALSKWFNEHLNIEP
jgi:hypothetical protein